VNGKLAMPDFYITWSPGITTEIRNNDGVCKRYWSGRPNPWLNSNKKSKAEEVYCDERIDKCVDL